MSPPLSQPSARKFIKMKTLSQLFIILILMLLSSCTKEDIPTTDTTEPDTEEPGSTTKKHRTWKGSAIDAHMQKDGKIICLGFLGKAGYDEKTHLSLYRLNEDGELDESFDASHLSEIWDDALIWGPLAIQPDNKILLGGSFYIEGKKQFLIRLLPDGKLDTEFMTNSDYEYDHYTPNYISLTKSGDIYAVYYDDVVRLKSDGSVDKSFSYELPHVYWNAPHLHSIKQLADGKLLLVSLADIIRLKNDGKIDQSFNFRYKPESTISGIYNSFSHIEVQSDGKLLLTGIFDKITDKMDEQKSYDYTNIARFHANGEIDESFPKIVNTTDTRISILADGSFLYPVTIRAFDNDYQQILRHVDKDGHVIAEKGISGRVNKVLPLSDKKMLLAGNFFEKYDYVTLSILLAIDPYATDNRPVIEINF